MKKRGVVFFVVAAALAAMVCLTGCGDRGGDGFFTRTESDQVIPESGYTKYSGGGYEFYYPSAWKKTSQSGVTILMPSGIATAGGSNINVVETAGTGEVSKITEKMLKDQLEEQGLAPVISDFQSGACCGYTMLRYGLRLMQVDEVQIMFETETKTVILTITVAPDDTALADLPETVFQSIKIA